MSLLAKLGTRRCRDNGDTDRRGGLEEVDAGVGVTEVGGGPKWSPFWDIDGTLGLLVNFTFVEMDGDKSCGGDVDKSSMLRRFETETTRGPGANARWPRLDGLGAADSPVVDAFTFTETFEVIRVDGVGLG